MRVCVGGGGGGAFRVPSRLTLPPCLFSAENSCNASASGSESLSACLREDPGEEEIIIIYWDFLATHEGRLVALKDNIEDLAGNQD